MKKAILLLSFCFATIVAGAHAYYGTWGGHYFWADTDRYGHITHLEVLGPCSGCPNHITQAWLIVPGGSDPSGGNSDHTTETMISNAGTSSFHTPSSDLDNDIQTAITGYSGASTYINLNNVTSSVRNYIIADQ